jgi:hypothetical protein
MKNYPHFRTYPLGGELPNPDYSSSAAACRYPIAANLPKGETSMKITIKLLIAMVLSISFQLAHADVIQIWNCKLQEGKTDADLAAATRTWLAASKKLPGNKKLEVRHNFPVVAGVGDGAFTFVTISPNFEDWGKAAQAYPGSESQKQDEAWAEIASCHGSSLWASEIIE